MQLNEGENKTNHINLNVDCVILIVEHLEFAELLNVAQVNEQFSSVAAYVFHHKYSHLQLMIQNNFLLPEYPNELLDAVTGMKYDNDAIERGNIHPGYLCRNPSNAKETERQIILEKVDEILNTFKHFGHTIKRYASGGYDNRPIQTELIGNLISKYSFESLIDFEIGLDAQKLLDKINKPLINVESLTFRFILNRNYPHFVPPIRCPNEVFPALRRLILDIVFVDWADFNSTLAYFDCHMPHLEHVFMIRSQNAIDKSPPTDIFKKNPQIRSVHLLNSETEFIQEVSDLLPHLEILKFSGYLEVDRTIHFGNVTTFKLGIHTSPANLHFPQLETLHLYYTSDTLANYVSFFNEHTHLRKLHLMYYDITDTEFQHLTANLPNLVELTLENRLDRILIKHLDTVIIVKFLTSHANVKQLNVISFFQHGIDELREQLKHEWNMKINGSGLSFVRTTNHQL